MKETAILRPRLSEKAYALSEKENTYIFQIPRTFNKQEIAEAVKRQYGVDVKSIRLAGAAGKTRRSIRRGLSVRQFKRAGVRKAYVALNEGDKLPIFAAVEEAKVSKPEEKK